MTVADVAEVRLRKATESDLPGMARIHRASYGPGHFLALLPERVLTEYYRLFLGGGSQAMVAEFQSAGTDTASLVGFAVFGANIEPRIGQFKREQRAEILLGALRHPLSAGRKVLLGVFGGPDVGSAHQPARWLLLSIAVSGAGRGVGSTLLKEMLRVAAAEGEERFGLYVRHSNFGAVNAYLRVGFRIVASMADQYYMEIDLRPLNTSGNH